MRESLEPEIDPVQCRHCGYKQPWVEELRGAYWTECNCGARGPSVLSDYPWDDTDGIERRGNNNAANAWNRLHYVGVKVPNHVH